MWRVNIIAVPSGEPEPLNFLAMIGGPAADFAVFASSGAAYAAVQCVRTASCIGVSSASTLRE